MLRIAILTSHPIQYQAPLFRELASRDIELKVFFCWDFGVEKTFDREFGKTFRWDIPLLEGYEYEFIPNISPRKGTHHFLGLVNPSAPFRILSWKPDVVILHGYAHLTDHLVFQSSRLRGVPVMMRGDSYLLNRRSYWITVAKRYTLGPLLRSLDGVLSIGTLNRRYYEYYGVRDERIFFAPYSVDNSFFRKDVERNREMANQWREQLGIRAEDIVILFAAKLISRKGCADLIRAYVAKQRENATLIIAGEGPLRRDLESLASSFPRASTKFVGFINQSQMTTLYALGDLFVLPSYYEPWGLAINEVMNLGCPVVVSDMVGCAPDLVSEKNGWVFSTGDVDALDSVLTEALGDREMLKSKGENSLALVDYWDIKHTADGFIEGARAVSKS